MNNIDKLDELNIAMNNAYDIITGQDTLDNIFTEQEHPIYLAFDPDKLDDDEYWDAIIDSMIQYFCDLEEYEKCHELNTL